MKATPSSFFLPRTPVYKSSISSSAPACHDSMGSDDDGAIAAAVCCMCGDHGLSGELFRCSLCRSRLQHRYCSELYPRETAYRSCNWCLRDGGRGGRRNPPVKTPTTAASKRRRTNSLDDSGDMMSPSGGCSRSAFSAEPGKPVKKPKKKKGAGTMEKRPVTMAAADGGRREEKAGTGRKVRFRTKVRRYKLLTEVIC
ncbi:hypothetical protein EJB05_21170, partial [Eragrostis curvula]